MDIGDEARIRVLLSLGKKGSVSPNIAGIQRESGLHKATIKSSLAFLSQKGVLAGFGPKVHFKNFGYKLEVVSILQLDLSEEAVLTQFLASCQSDPHVYGVSSIIGSGNWNLMLRHYYRDVESFHADWEKNFTKKIPGLFRLVRDRQVFYLADPVYKEASRTDSVLSLLKSEKGMD
jgi:DNA-binding Lrp family transcriptional regulator